MVNRSKGIGTKAETAFTRAARERGFPHADRLTLTGENDRGDVRLTAGLTAGVVVEVKGGDAAKRASLTQLEAWLAEAERERRNAGAAVAFLVTQRAGVGLGNAHDWWAHTTLAVLADLRGYDRGLHRLIDDTATVRLTVASMLVQLRAGGYGEPLPQAAAALREQVDA